MQTLRTTRLRATTTFTTCNTLLKPAASILSNKSQLPTTTPTPSSHRPTTTTVPSHRNYSSASLTFIPTRHASTTTPSSTSNTPETTVLNWNEFLRLRRIRRFYNLGGSVVAGATSLVTGASIVATEDITGMGQQLTGLDPFVIMGLWTFGFGGLGWLLGPILGSSIFGMVYRRFGGQMRSKEKDFFERIKKYRVDPTSSSMQNPVPDYYGEKITSVAGYRRWLKDQRAFNKKRQSFV